MLDILVRKGVVMSECSRYRYLLRRTWDDHLPPLVIGMLNPSTADHEVDDPTIRRCISLARRLKCGSLLVWNLGAGRATDPKVWKAMKDPIGFRNDRWIIEALEECRRRNGIAVAAWGTHGFFMNRYLTVLRIAKDQGIKFKCLGTTKHGQPRHPLYISSSQALQLYTP